MDHTFSIWQVSAGHTPGSATSAASGGGHLTIVNLGGQGTPSQLIETVATTGGTSAVFGSGSREIYQQHPTRATVMNEPILLQIPDQRQYVVDESSIQNVDQMPPVNLIMGTTVDPCDESGGDQVFHLPTEAATPGELTMDEYDAGCEQMMQPNHGSCEETQYTEECEVMEEVITDDWVQSQGEECVQVTVDQLGSSTVAGTVEDEISVPLDQDEYTLSRPFPCDFCSRRFRKKANLLNHLVAHSNDRPYVCNLCGAQYGRRIDLANHFKQHAYAANNQDEATLRSDHEIEYDMPGLHMSHHVKQRTQQSSEDEDMFNEGSRAVSYNSQPPMQLISSTNSTAAYAGGSVVRIQYTNEPDASVVGMNSILEDGPMYSFAPPMGEHKSGPSRKAHRSTANETGPHPTKRQAPRAGKAAKGNRRNATSGHIKQEALGPHEAALSSVHNNGLIAPPYFPVVDERKPFVCQQCGVSFGREKALASHARVHGGDTQYRCITCDERFWDRSLLQNHIRQKHPDVYPQPDHGATTKRSAKSYAPVTTVGPFTVAEVGWANDSHRMAQVVDARYNCDSCQMGFDRPELVKKHIQETHGIPSSPTTGQGVRCDPVIVKQEVNGGILFDSSRIDSPDEGNSPGFKPATDYDEQNDDSTQQEELYCSDCGKSFMKSSDLQAHIRKLHPRTEPHECQLCGEKFPNETVIKQHVQEWHRDELTDTSCAICGKLCKSQTSLMKHSWDHSRERAHCCSKCGKTFHHMGRLKRHMGSHRNKTVRCEVCGEEFPDGRTLMNHRHSHSKSNNYPCKECGKTFGSRSSQQIHLRIHTGERPYACRFCWKAFADGGTLRKHERVHTGEKPYGCSVCPKEFNQRVVLREHIRAHHSQPDTIRGSVEMPFFCPVCTSQFATAAELVQHLIEHSDTNTAQKRKPPTFPRKYKRRRKLKPHELERLQSGRRKQKTTASTTTKADSRQSDEDEGSTEDGEEDGAEQYERTVSLEREDGTLKTSSELFLEYGDSKIQKLAVASSKFISPYELLGEGKGDTSEHGGEPKKGQAADCMLDDIGINLLSNGDVHDQRDQQQSSKVNNNHLPESLSKRKTTRGAQVQPKTSPSVSGARMIRTQPAKRAAPKKPGANVKQSKTRATAAAAANSTKDVLSATAGSNSVSHALEAFSALEKKRSRTRPMPSYVREIPSDKISKNFPLLDDGNTDDAMEEPMDVGSDDRAPRPQYGRQRYISSTSNASVSRDDEDEQLLIEISRGEKYTDRFNSDIVNDLAEILRSPLKGPSGSTTSVPPVDILASPTSRQAVPPFFSLKEEKLATAKAIAGSIKTPRVSKSHSKLGIPTATSRQRTVASSSSSNAITFPAVLPDACSASLPYGHGRRLTRRQLEREVNFLSEAYAPEAPNPRPSANVCVEGPYTTVSTFSIGDGRSVVIKQENAPEKLAEMLLNDGIPADPGSGRSSASGQDGGDADDSSMNISTLQAKLERLDGAAEEEPETETNDSDGRLPTTAFSSLDAVSNRCSICAACFEDRSQLILHVPIHM